MKKYIHPAIIKKDLMRFSPLWGLTSVFITLYLLLIWSATDSAAQIFKDIEYVLMFMGAATFVYAGICALCLFGDLFDTRLCNALHAMPVSREGWFWSHVASGLLFCLIPGAIGTVICSLMLGEYYIGALLWLALTVLEFLFFFGAAAFSALCAGTKLGAVAVYTVINTLVYLISFIFTFLFQPLLYGVFLNVDAPVTVKPAQEEMLSPPPFGRLPFTVYTKLVLFVTPPETANPRPAAEPSFRSCIGSMVSKLISFASNIPCSSSKVRTKSTSERISSRIASSFFAAQGPTKTTLQPGYSFFISRAV